MEIKREEGDEKEGREERRRVMEMRVGYGGRGSKKKRRGNGDEDEREEGYRDEVERGDVDGL